MKFNILFYAGLLFFTINTNAQKINHNLYINDGIDFLSNKESHYTSNLRSGIGYNILIGYERKGGKSINRISLFFLQTKTGKGNLSGSNILHSELKYEHLWKITKKEIYLGAYINIGGLINLRTGYWTKGTKISYAIWSSLGISTQFQKQLIIKKLNINWINKFSFPIVSYLIRPSYAFAYTDNYLYSNVFQRGEKEPANKIITGGKIVSWDKFLKFRYQTEITMPTNNKKWEFGVNYIFDFIQTREIKPMIQTSHQINLITRFTL